MSAALPTDRAAKARDVAIRKAAARRAADPAQLSKALRTVEAAVISDPNVYRLLDGIMAARKGAGDASAA